MSLKCGIVGLPNVGKSTLFNALTKAGIAAENYPFCTIEPNVGIVEVPDPRLAAAGEIAKPQQVHAAIVEFVDIAGLVAGASKGEGLGNQFLANIRETDAHRQCGALLRRRQRDPRRRQDRSDLRHRNHPHRTGAGRSRDRGKSASNATASWRKSGDKEAQAAGAVAGEGAGASEPGQTGAHADADRRTSCAAQAAVPAHRQAGDVRRQRRGRRVRRDNPLLEVGEAARREGRRAGGGDLCARSKRNRRPVRRGQAGVPGRYRAGRTGPEPPDPRRLRPAGPADLLHRRARRKCAPGPSTRATLRRRPRA